jgi:hypothetical protein
MSRTYKDTKRGKKALAKKFGGIYCWFQYGGIPSWYKRMRKRIRKAKEKDALRNGEDPPLFKRGDEYEWW